MKLFKGVGLGIFAGLIVACVISLGVVFLPGLSCTCEFVVAFLDCDNSYDHLDAAGRHCEQLLGCEEGPAQRFDYQSAFIFSTLICTAIGGIWGVAGTMKDANEAARKRKAIIDKERNDRHTANQKEVIKKLAEFVSYAERTSYSLHKQFDEIQYYHDNKKNNIETALNNCKKKREETESIMNRLTSEKD